MHRRDRAAGRFLHRQNMPRDLLGRFRGFHRERFDFGGDDGEAAARFTGSRRLDGGVQRQQIGLAGDVANELDDVANLFGGLRQAGIFGIVALASFTASVTNAVVCASC